jgi:DNA-binding MarR family transcriptional regulator
MAHLLNQRRKAGLGLPATSTASASTQVEPVFNALRRLVHALHSASREAERKLGVTGAQLFVLAQLRDSPALSINALAERTMTHQSTVSVVVRRLVRRRLVKKVRATEDARRVELTLTPTGRALLRRAPEAAQLRLMRAIEEVPTAERRALARGLAKLVAALGASEAPAALFFEAVR